MGDMHITDITHFEGLPPKLSKGPAGRMVVLSWSPQDFNAQTEEAVVSVLLPISDYY